jgi:hypothetical protein
VRAHLATLVPYRIAAGVLEHFLPVEAGITHETLRGCTLKLGEEVRDAAAVQPAVAASAITVSVDSTYIRSCEDGQRHLELGNVETVNGARQVFAAVARTDTAIETLIRRGLKEVGQTPETELTAFTDGCSGLRSILVNAGITKPPYLDWFHIAMRLQHAEKTASTLPAETPARENARAVIVAEVLRWRIWNGKDAKVTIERIRAVISRANRAAERGIRRHAGWRCARSTAISPVKVRGWSTMPNAIGPVCGSARRSPKVRLTSWSTAA